MHTDRLTGDLDLTDRERGLLESLLDSLAAACERRLPPELVLVGLGLEVGRPEDFNVPVRRFSSGRRIATPAGEQLH